MTAPSEALAVMPLLEWLAARPAPAAGQLALGERLVRWDAAALTLEEAGAAAPLVLAARGAVQASLQLSRWSRTVEVPAASLWRRLFGGTDKVERHELLVELRSSRTRLRLCALVERPERLEGLVRMDATRETVVELDALEALLAAAVALEVPLVRVELTSAHGSSWLRDGEGRREAVRREPAAAPRDPASESAPEPAPAAPPTAPPPLADDLDELDAPTPREPVAPFEEMTPLEPVEAMEAVAPAAPDAPAAPPPPAPRLERVRVGFDAQCEARSLEEALARVLPGGRLELGPGRFVLTGPLELAHSLSVTGSGPGRSTIVGREAPLLRFAPGASDPAARLELAELSIAASAPTRGRDAALVELAGGSTRLSACEVVGAGEGHGIDVASADAELRLVNSAVRGHGGDGVRVRQAASVLISGGVLERNGGAGLRLGGSARASVEQVRARYNGEAGIVLEGHVEAALTQCTASHNRDGIVARQAAVVRVEGCECMRNAHAGIALRDETVRGRVRGNRCVGNAVGLEEGPGLHGLLDLGDNLIASG